MTRRGRGAGAFLLSLALLVGACVSEVPRPASSLDDAALRSLARDAAAIFARVALYDYALAGHFAGERRRIVAPDRYGAALAPELRALDGLKGRATAAAFRDDARAPALAHLADATGGLEDALRRFAVARDAVAFARIVDALDAAWSALRALAALLGTDAELERAIGEARARRVLVARTPTFAVVTAPAGARAAVFANRREALARADELRDVGVAAAVVEEDQFAFTRSGPDPGGELWREPALDVPLAERARRASFIEGGFAVAHENGTLRAYDVEGQVRWSTKVGPGTAILAPRLDGRAFVVAGPQVALVTAQGQVLAQARLPSAASGAAWAEPQQVVLVGSPGTSGLPEGGAGAIVALSADGKALEEPFPLVTPAAGPLLATWPGREEIWIATTSRGATDLELVRPLRDATTRAVLRVDGQHRLLSAQPDGSRGLLVTSAGTYRFTLRGTTERPGLDRLGDAAREARFTRDALYVLWRERVVAYDGELRVLWTAPLADGRRLAAGRRIVVQDGLSRLLAFDPKTGVAEELAGVGEIVDLAVSADGERVLLLADGRRAVLFALR